MQLTVLWSLDTLTLCDNLRYIQGPRLPTWINANPSMDKLLHPLSSVDEITYSFPNFNGAVISSHTLLGMWLLAHAGIKVHSY